MTSLVKRGRLGLAGALALGALSIVPAGPAYAAEDCAAPTGSAPSIAVGVHDVKTLTYTVIAHQCIREGDQQIVPNRIDVTLAKGGVNRATKQATKVATYGDPNFPTTKWVAKFTFNPAGPGSDVRLWDNSYAGSWRSYVKVTDNYEGEPPFSYSVSGGFFNVKRYARVDSLDASPEPAAANETIAARLVRASWNDLKYHGVPYQDVKLQFRTMTGSYSTVKTVKSDVHGRLRTTTPTVASGCYRYYYLGMLTTSAATSPGDCVQQ
jgi:hypothetical protein